MRENFVSCATPDFAIGRDASDEIIRLIRKLRWIGKEEEAHGLERQLDLLPAMQRGSVLADSINTD